MPDGRPPRRPSSAPTEPTRATAAPMQVVSGPVPTTATAPEPPDPRTYVARATVPASRETIIADAAADRSKPRVNRPTQITQTSGIATQHANITSSIGYAREPSRSAMPAISKLERTTRPERTHGRKPPIPTASRPAIAPIALTRAAGGYLDVNTAGTDLP